jgi:hypothetical protein
MIHRFSGYEMSSSSGHRCGNAVLLSCGLRDNASAGTCTVGDYRIIGKVGRL